MAKNRLQRYFSRSLIARLQLRSELTHFVKIIRELNPRRLMEIGRDRGGTLLLFTRACQSDCTVVSVDLVELPYRRAVLLRRLAGSTRKIHLFAADSHSPKTLNSVTDTLHGNLLDVLFIDGDHSYAGVKRDFEMYAPLVRQGGVVAFHDIAVHPPEAKCEVSEFWDEVKTHYRHLEIIEDREQGWAGIGVLYV